MMFAVAATPIFIGDLVFNKGDYMGKVSDINTILPIGERIQLSGNKLAYRSANRTCHKVTFADGSQEWLPIAWIDIHYR